MSHHKHCHIGNTVLHREHRLRQQAYLGDAIDIILKTEITTKVTLLHFCVCALVFSDLKMANYRWSPYKQTAREGLKNGQIHLQRCRMIRSLKAVITGKGASDTYCVKGLNTLILRRTLRHHNTIRCLVSFCVLIGTFCFLH